MTGRILRFRGGVREALLWCGAVLGVICLLAALAAAVFDIKPLVFRSGSMAPAIETGALGLAGEVGADQIEVGDIVSVVNAESVRVTHRVIEVEGAAEGVVLHLQGDANTTPDTETYPVSSVDWVFASLPYAGYVVAWASGPAGVFAGGVLVGVLLLVAFGPGSRRRRDPGPGEAEDSAGSAAKAKPGRRAGALVALVVLALGVQGAHQSQDTMANWTDQATARSGTFGGHALAPPAILNCSNQGGIGVLLGFVRTTWSNVDTRYGYRAELIRLDTGQRVGNVVDIAPQSGAQVTFDFTMGLLVPGSGARNYDLRIYSRLPGTTWVSTTHSTIQVRTVSLLGIGLSLRCGHG